MDLNVSVIIPCYNHAHGLPDAIRSVRAQDWPGVEIIVVDDGSTDDTPRRLRDLNGSDLRTLQQNNQGPAAARNVGVRAAQGDWVAFLDADDYWLPGKLAAQFELLANHPEADFIYGGVVVQAPDGSEREIKCDFGGQPLLLVLLGGNRLFTPTVMVRRDSLKEAGLFHVELRTGEDWDLWLRLATRCKSVGISKPLAVIRKHAGSNSYPLPLLEDCTLTILERLFSNAELLAQWPELEAEKKHVYAWQYSVLARSYGRSGGIIDFLRLGFKAAFADVAGLGYLLSRSRAPVFGECSDRLRAVTTGPS